MLLTPDQESVRDAVRAFAQAELWPHAARWDKEHTFPKDVHKGLAALGAYGICVPEEFGGAQMDYLTLAVVLEEIAAGDGGTSTVISVTNCPVNAILLRYGNAAQKKQWLTPLAQGQMLGAFCLTEPHVGSDASSLRTTAVREGDEYVIKGQKVYISNAQQAHVIIVACKTNPHAGAKGISLVIVETDRPGFVRGKMLKKIGRKAQDTLELYFDEVRVPVSNLLGSEEGQGFYQLMGLLVQERLTSAIRSIAAMQIALDDTVRYVKER